jgi:alkanesulfonate monooxygenase SsuD/methylene tetrahydromethanopterin reductase-like flavin-dependent oxidoreductase (luciferase family)
MPRFNISFDMRSPEWATPTPKLYAAALEMSAYADKAGIDYAMLMEHHGVDDGYLCSPPVLGAAIAARTERMRILLGVIVLPLHDPVQLAEQIAILDQISDGRVDCVFGIGYVPSEYRMFGKSMKDRARLIDDGLTILQRAFSGERFTFGDREIFVRPLPVQKPWPPMWLGGGVPATAKRAARFGAGIFPTDPSIATLYREECARLGKQPGPVRYNYGWIHVTEDPERSWRELAPHMMHVAKSYSDMAEETYPTSPFKGLDTLDKIKASRLFHVATPDECVAMAQKADERGGDWGLMPLLGGLDPDIGWKSLELFVEKVLPRVRG